MLTRKPRKGDRVRWPDWPAHQYATVVRTPEDDNNLCWILQRGESRPQPFIWKHPDGLNTLAEIVDSSRPESPRSVPEGT